MEKPDTRDNVLVLDAWRRKMKRMGVEEKTTFALSVNGAIFTAVNDVLAQHGLDMNDIPRDHFMKIMQAGDTITDALVETVEFHRSRREDT